MPVERCKSPIPIAASNFQGRVAKQIETQTGFITCQELYPKTSKPILDKIDAVLARHYGRINEDLDFIINYDIKYRLGADAEEE